MSHAEDLELYRRLAAAERETAESSSLPNVKNRSLRAAERWDELAARAERAQAQANNRTA